MLLMGSVHTVVPKIFYRVPCSSCSILNEVYYMAIDNKSVRNVENVVRDFKNWLAVFKTEYSVADEAVKVLNGKVDEFSGKLAGVACDVSGKIKPDSMKPAANTLRDAKAWLAVFASEYSLSPEAKKVLADNFNKVGDALAQVDCK